MSFTLTLHFADTSFQLVRRALVLDDKLPFAQQLTVEQIEAARSRSPEMAEREWRVGLLAYNVVRQSLLQAAVVEKCHPRQLSFTSAMQSLANDWLLVSAEPETAEPLCQLRVKDVGSHRVGNRPSHVDIVGMACSASRFSSPFMAPQCECPQTMMS